MEQFILPLFILAIAAMMFFSMRKQKRMQQEQQQMQNSISVGDRVMTTSGLYGTVVEAGDSTIHLEVAPGVHTEWLRLAIREKVADDVEEIEETEDEVDEVDEIVEHDTVDDTRETVDDDVKEKNAR